MTQLRTPADWWSEYDIIKDHILGYIDASASVAQILSRAHSIGGWQAQPFLELFGSFEGQDIRVEDAVRHWREAEDARSLHRFLNSIWLDAPDKPYIHEWPAWGRFCDLCSEGPVCFGWDA